MWTCKNKSFDWTDRLAFWLSCGIAFVVYFASLGPSVGLEDSGELATAAEVLGVPHPPGYPLWTMISWLFCRVFSGVTYWGYPNPAWAVSLGSAMMGALAAGVTALLITRSARDLMGVEEGENVASAQRLRISAAVSGVAASLAFAFSPVMWSQSVIVEVYALGALFLALVMLLLYEWFRRPRASLLVILGLVFGLGLTNYQVLLLAGFPIALLIFLRNRKLAFSFLAVLIPFALTAYLLSLGALASADMFSTQGGEPVILRPLTEEQAFCAAPIGFYLSVVVGLLIALAGWWWWRFSRACVLALVIIAVLTGMGLFLAPSKLPDGFVGTLYNFGHAWGVHAIGLGLLWCVCGRFRRMRKFAASVTTVQVMSLILLQEGLLVGLTDPNTVWFWWPIVWGAIVLVMAYRLLLRGRCVALTVAGAVVGMSIYAYMPLVSDLLNPAMNWGYPRTWEGFKHALSRGQYEAIEPASFFSAKYLSQLWSYVIDLRMQFSLPVIAVAVGGTGALFVALIRGRAVVCERHRRLMWLLCTGLFFLVMSALLIALANPRGDLQDGFIQKVKFISSHGVFALWVGYGLMVLLMVCARLSRKVWWGLLAVAMIVPAMPFAENFFNRGLVHAMGAAEQTGHDFGWQFGTYMLGGAPTIRQQLTEEEEPLPDPFWPPPMEQGAVFFGGTDPGRFVPTYMVYAANFRSDIYVFTQNALADATYMNVERDLYGNQLWIPSADNVHDAFTSYVDDVQAGRRKGKGTITESNGRMQISGSASVMSINADLSRMIFDRNPTHTFYVEESYPIDWMKTQLEPAGLAMRLVRERKADLEAVQTRDADFWDWMTRRLAVRTDFRRDFVAQKSFSKLRSSIGGVYAMNGKTVAAERAFAEALWLFPISPEVIFRYVQEGLIPFYRFADAIRLLKTYGRADPNNVKVPYLIDRLEALESAYADFTRLTKKVRAKKITTVEVCELARAAESLNLHTVAADYWEQIIVAEDLSAGDAKEGCMTLLRFAKDEGAMSLLRRVPEAVWGTFSEDELLACSALAQKFSDRERALRLLQFAVSRSPKSGKVWLSIALFYYETGDHARAYDYMMNAIRYGAAPLIQENAAVAEVYLQLMKRYTQQK
ncbi:MAG: DUF2723 domain-containing protein [Kiritimatiellia bacterium]